MWGDSCRGGGERSACRSQEQRGDQARVGVEPKKQGGVTKGGSEAGEQRGASQRAYRLCPFHLHLLPANHPQLLGQVTPPHHSDSPQAPHHGLQHTPRILSLQSPSFMGFKYFLLTFCHRLTQLPEDPGLLSSGS